MSELPIPPHSYFKNHTIHFQVEHISNLIDGLIKCASTIGIIRKPMSYNKERTLGSSVSRHNISGMLYQGVSILPLNSFPYFLSSVV